MCSPSHKRFRKPFVVLAVILAVIEAKTGGDGWESNPPRTPQQRPANGFEDRGSCVHCRPSTSITVRFLARTFHGHARSSADVQQVGCQLGCHSNLGRGDLVSRACVKQTGNPADSLESAKRCCCVFG